MKLNRFKVLKVIVAIVVLFAVIVNVIKLIKELRVFNNIKTDVAVQYEEKLKPIKKLLPSGVNIGYKNDEKDFGKSGESFYLTQYVLSPNKVLKNEIPEYVIASFNNPKGKAIFIKKNKLCLVKDIDNKTALYTRKSQ